MIEIIKMEQKPVTDQEVTEALRTLRQYCKEHEDTGPECQGSPTYWELDKMRVGGGSSGSQDNQGAPGQLPKNKKGDPHS